MGNLFVNNNQKTISVVFAFVIFLLVGLGLISLFYLKDIAANVKNLYNHPYTVSNAVRDINMNLISMHRYMKDVVLAENEAQLNSAVLLVNKHE